MCQTITLGMCCDVFRLKTHVIVSENPFILGVKPCAVSLNVIKYLWMKICFKVKVKVTPPFV